MCTPSPSATTQPAPEFSGDRFEVVGFESDASLSDADFTHEITTRVPGSFSIGGQAPTRTTRTVDRPTGIHGARQYKVQEGRQNVFGGTAPFSDPTPRLVSADGVNKSGVSKQEDGSYLGAVTSRINPETGKREYGRYKFGGSTRGEFGIFEGKLGKPKDFGYQPIDKSKVSDTRHLKTAQPLTVGKKSLRLKSSGGLSRAKTAGLVVGKEATSVPASGVNVPKG